MPTVSTEVFEDIAVIIIDNPPVNALSHAVRLGISDALKDVAENQIIKAIILICAGRTFCAGADISEFGKPPLEPTLPDLMAQMDQVEKPIIAGLHGTALGGGFEVALCAHYRIMEATAKVGLPEVNLGLIPGAGGTQRLPRLIGITAALNMITSGKPVNADKATKLGIADKLSTVDLKTNAIEFARDIIKQNLGIRRLSDLKLTAEEEVFNGYRDQISRKSRGFLAPFAAIDAIKAASEGSFSDGLMFEREKFVELVNGSQSKAQRHLFFAERAASKIPGIERDTPVRKIEKIAVIGGGIMGCGITVNFLNKGLSVTLLDVSKEACVSAGEKVTQIYASSVKKGRITQAQMDKNISLFSTSSDYTDIKDVDLAIEAVFEDESVKKAVFKELDIHLKQGAILATNTSFLDVNEIAGATSRPEDVIGLHFFSPAHIMPLLEIVRTEQTAIDVLATALKIGKMIGKTSIVSGVCYGFIANRMSSCYGREAGLLLLEGATPSQVDKVMFEFGMPMGMFSMLDMAGIDIGVMAREKLPVSDYDERAFSIHAALVAGGAKGQKSGSGFYHYGENGKIENPEVKTLAEELSAKYAIIRREITDQEIEERCVYALINEGFKIVDEGIAIRASDVDVVYASAFGFPRYKGGPLHYAENVGHDHILHKINEFAKSHGERWWTPSKRLIDLAQQS